MFKKQSKSCIGSLGTGSDTDRTRFLVNVISWNSKNITQEPVPLLVQPGSWYKIQGHVFWEMLEPGSLLGRNRFLKGYFQKFFLKKILNKVFLNSKHVGYVYDYECIFCEHLYSRLRIIYTILTFDDFFNNSSIIFKTFIWCW